ncbi:integrase core domain-containing protein, partial [Bacteroidota bacterium]
IERYHRSMKNVIKLDNYYSPGELNQRLSEFIEYYNNFRYHESLNNLTPADVFYGRDQEILEKRQRGKLETIKNRKNEYANKKLNLSA